MQRRNFVTALMAGLMGWITGESQDAHSASAQAVRPAPPVSTPTLPTPSPETDSLAGKRQHTEWLRKAAVEIGTIKPGMTRADLMRLFEGQGGYHPYIRRLHRTFLYRDCNYIKVEVDFQPVPEDLDSKGRPSPREQPEDIITKISRPFIEPAVVVD